MGLEHVLGYGRGAPLSVDANELYGLGRVRLGFELLLGYGRGVHLLLPHLPWSPFAEEGWA